MGVTALSATQPAAPVWIGWTRSPVALARLAVASVVVNVGIVVTGGAVRLSESGLGCPTWPRCSGSSLVPRAKLGVNGVIEFSNRTLTFLVGLTLLLTAIAAWRQHRETRLAVLALIGVPAQAVLGGIVVLTDLNPWLVAAHFLVSAAIIALTYLLWWRVTDQSTGLSRVHPAVRTLCAGLATWAAFVLVAGTLVTGAGPHAGDLKNGKVHRIHLSIAGLAQLHADLVMVLIGLTVGVLVAARVVGSAVLARAALLLLGVELAQGIIGYTQYFLHVPPLLVGFHMFGACLVWLAALRVLLTSRSTAPA